jgi:hypothetical protein
LLSAVDLAASRTPVTDPRVFFTAHAVEVTSDDQAEKCEVIFAKQDRLGEIPEIIKGAARQVESADAANRLGY